MEWAGIGLIGMVLFWVLIIAGIVLLVKWLTGGQQQQSSEPRRDTALEVLKKRYARGEIGREEYEQKKRDLDNLTPSPEWRPNNRRAS